MEIYSESDLQFIEGNIFKINIPLISDSDQALSDIEKLLKFCNTPKSITEMMEYMEYSNRTYFRNNILDPLIEEGKLFLTEPDKPISPK